MDPVTQGTLGAALPQGAARREHMGLATLCGFLAGMAPDLDVLIRSSEDPLLFLEYHRQFTHSLLFIPVGAALVAGALWLLAGRRWHWAPHRMYFFCLLGYATHALLDACTSYGTQLLWPFSSQRFAWNNVSIIDPLLTLPLLAGVLASGIARRALFARLGLAWVITYLLVGVLAAGAARDEGMAIAFDRGHRPESLEARPSFGNLLLWKIVYEAEDRYYVDAVRLGVDPRVYAGTSVPTLDLERDFPWLDGNSVQARDVERFRWFSMGHLAVDPANPSRIIDVRYSLLPNDIRGLWSIELDAGASPGTHVRYLTHRDARSDTFPAFLAMLRGEPLPARDAGPSELTMPSSF